MLLPGVLSYHATASRYSVHADVEGDADDDEEPEEDDLDNETTDCDVFAILQRRERTACHYATAGGL